MRFYYRESAVNFKVQPYEMFTAGSASGVGALTQSDVVTMATDLFIYLFVCQILPGVRIIIANPETKGPLGDSHLGEVIRYHLLLLSFLSFFLFFSSFIYLILYVTPFFNLFSAFLLVYCFFFPVSCLFRTLFFLPSITLQVYLSDAVIYAFIHPCS